MRIERCDDADYEREASRLRRLLEGAVAEPLVLDLKRAAGLLTDIGVLLDAATVDEQRTIIRTVFSNLWVEQREIKAVTPTSLYLPLVGVLKMGWLTGFKLPLEYPAVESR